MTRQIHLAIVAALAGGGLLLSSLEALAGVTLPFEGECNGVRLGDNWTNHLASGNIATVEFGAIQFRAAANTHAHVERALATDLIKISCAIKADASATPSLLALCWEDSNFIQFGINSPVNGRLNVREVLGTYPHDYDLGAMDSGQWEYIGIELARDGIRYLGSHDGKVFETVQVSPRPARFGGAPKLLILGQDCDGKLFPRPSPWMTLPPSVLSETNWIKDLRVEALGQKRLNLTAGERRQIAERGSDQVGEQELASKDDPSFQSVSRHFPALKWSREIVGVKDHPFDIGVAPDGSLQLSDNIASFHKATAFFQIGDYRFGSAGGTCAKKLYEGWKPVVTTSDSHDGLQFEQTVFGWTKGFAPDEELFGFIQFRAFNPTDTARNVNVRLVFSAPTNAPAPLIWRLELPAHGSQMVSARLPYKLSGASPVEVTAAEYQSKLADTSEYWNNLIAAGSRFEIPEPRVQNAYRAWLAYNFLNVAKRNGNYDVCDGSGFYGQVYGYSAALYCNGLDLLGYHQLAETYCDSLLARAHTNGLLAVNFGDTDTGTALWVMAEHFRLTHDVEWLHRVALRMRLMCGWIVNQRHLALAKANTEPVVARGLIRYQPYADLLHPAADYFSNGYLWKGLDATARVFADIGLSEEAIVLQREADSYHQDIKTSMNAAVFKDRGQKILPIIPDSHELWKESDGSADGYYGIIAPCLLEIGLPDAKDEKAKFITRALENRGGLVAGITQFHRMADHAYTYGYWLNCLQRDDVRRAILGLYGSLAYGMSTDTYAAVECTSIQTGENYWMLPHTYSNTQQLRLLRNMLVREDGDSLWLGQAIPRDWLAPGKRVAVNAAPTTFGPVTYSIEANAEGSIHVSLSPPVRIHPHEILLRLRDPRQRSIARVKSQGVGKVKFSKDTVRLTGVSSPLSLDVSFK